MSKRKVEQLMDEAIASLELMEKREFLSEYIKADGYTCIPHQQLADAEDAYFVVLAQRWLERETPSQFGWWWRHSPADFCSNGCWQPLYLDEHLGLVYVDDKTVVKTSKDVRDILKCRIINPE